MKGEEKMFRFKRGKILPRFLKSGITVSKLAHKAGTCHAAAFRAVNGLPIQATVVERISTALDFDPLDYLEKPAEQREEDNHHG
ncbi:MAG: hypothetical protein IJP68_00045 [Selenomonadaceae bacterium]|nr:hypothetical protein [Selenomonadaceae bacterium]